MDTPLESAQARMLAALRALGPGWHNRATIANQVGKAQLNQLEYAALDQLAALGGIESQLVQGSRRGVQQWQYRLPEGAK